MTFQTQEYNFDGLIGPTHNYAGLSIGNRASMKHKDKISNPKQASLEGLEKMKFLMERGYKQALLPPQERPNLNFLRKLGFTGSDKNLVQSAGKASPVLLASCYSASAMWTANSATVSPSADTKDNKVHFTPANLQSFLHRTLESEQTYQILKKIFPNPTYFTHHPPLPSSPALSDEGSANHNRLGLNYGSRGVEVFVYGHSGFSTTHNTKKFYSRQSRLASEIIALRHQLKPQKTIMAKQNPSAIDTGVFHNDVICVADQNLIFYHELAFTNTKKVLKEIKQALSPTPLIEIPVQNKEVSLKESVSSYLFNSQLLPTGKNQWMLLAPRECEKSPVVKEYLDSLTKTTVIKKVCFIPIRQSMQNGGGPACLRLRVVLRPEEEKATHKGVFLSLSLYEQIKAWIKKHYRDHLKAGDLLDPLLISESRTALDELSRILKLGCIYSFQQ